MSELYPGIKAKHAVITPNCRVVQGGPCEAFDEAAQRLKAEYEVLLAINSNKAANFHLILTVERPPGCDHRHWKRLADGRRRCIIVGCGAILTDGYFAPPIPDASPSEATP
jgi:hypothetical protein